MYHLTSSLTDAQEGNLKTVGDNHNPDLKELQVLVEKYRKAAASISEKDKRKHIFSLLASSGEGETGRAGHEGFIGCEELTTAMHTVVLDTDNGRLQRRTGCSFLSLSIDSFIADTPGLNDANKPDFGLLLDLADSLEITFRAQAWCLGLLQEDLVEGQGQQLKEDFFKEKFEKDSRTRRFDGAQEAAMAALAELVGSRVGPDVQKALVEKQRPLGEIVIGAELQCNVTREK
ncbi:uncharacterized protein BDR25DRAFT_317099 [Lindgomyces ingoldianus]|uniref:Uncharacterized protein n=1 Tax=Lindgomyces ingoldianus TaxID=673940 RepID=A0ACB6QKG7_9PLEO|nr:uncharacterized protein BDR25DRAFT_317099 [Lindgomyces ingoldianus]KAF2467357.1 hypothetical protein BDR25DRAFT_317099 [Lindgomyces ingoldianus]